MRESRRLRLSGECSAVRQKTKTVGAERSATYRVANSIQPGEYSMGGGMDGAPAQGSVAKVNGNRNVPYLNRNDAKRNLNLNWWDNDWNDNYRFLAVRHCRYFSRPVWSGVLFMICRIRIRGTVTLIDRPYLINILLLHWSPRIPAARSMVLMHLFKCDCPPYFIAKWNQHCGNFSRGSIVSCLRIKNSKEDKAILWVLPLWYAFRTLDWVQIEREVGFGLI